MKLFKAVFSKEENVKLTETVKPEPVKESPPEEGPLAVNEQYKTEKHKVTGTNYKKKELLSLADENDCFELTKRDIIDLNMTDERIYQYNFHFNDIKIVPEPDNEYDPNALKVLLDDTHVGYIKKGSCSRVRNLLKKGPPVRIEAKVGGGRYKIVYSYYDYETDKETYELERGSSVFYVTLFFTYKI